MAGNNLAFLFSIWQLHVVLRSCCCRQFMLKQAMQRITADG